MASASPNRHIVRPHALTLIREHSANRYLAKSSAITCRIGSRADATDDNDNRARSRLTAHETRCTLTTSFRPDKKD